MCSGDVINLEAKQRLQKETSETHLRSPPTWQGLILQHSNLHLAWRELAKTTYFKHHIITKSGRESFLHLILDGVSKVLDHLWYERGCAESDSHQISPKDRRTYFITVPALKMMFVEKRLTVWAAFSLLVLASWNPGPRTPGCEERQRALPVFLWGNFKALERWTIIKPQILRRRILLIS